MKPISRLIRPMLAALLPILLFAPSRLVSQVTQESLPSGPLLNKRAPEYAQWKVATQYLTKKEMESAGTDASSKAGDGNGTLVSEQTITKTREIVRVERVTEAKQSWVNWIHGNVEILVWPDGKNCALLASGTSDNPNPHHVDLNASDFPGFEWVSSSSFKGFKNYQGTKCMFFEGKGNFSIDSEGRPVQSAATAYVDLATRLPIALKYDGVLVVYTWNTPPSKMLTFPPNVQAVMDLRTKATKELLGNAVSPY